MGSKRRYDKYIVPIIQKYIDENNINCFVDIFCGGANLVDEINCEKLIANDLSPSLIELHRKAQTNFSQIPEDGSREYWDEAYAAWKRMKKILDSKPEGQKYLTDEDLAEIDYPLYKIGAIEWYASFSNGGFPRGYAKNSATRNYYQEAYRNHKKQSEKENYKKIKFVQGDYRDIFDYLEIDDNIVLYCDSPYKGTKPYAINSKFNHEEYYNWLREVSKIYPIFISEQWMPDDFTIVWEKDVKRTAGADNNFKACEKLYFIDNRKEF